MAKKPIVQDEQTLSFDDIMAAPDMETEFVPMPMWGKTAAGDPRGVWIRPLAGGENVKAYEAATVGGKVDTVRYNKALVAASLVSPALTDEQIDALWANRSDRACMALIARINTLNAFDGKAVDELDAEFRPAGE